MGASSGYIFLIGLVTILCLGTIGTVIASLLTSRWFEVGIGPLFTANGLYKQCAPDCTDMAFNDYDCPATSELRTGKAAKMRYEVVQGCLYAGVIAAAIACFAALTAIGFRDRSVRALSIMAYIVCGFSLISGLVIAAGVLVFVETMENWWNCNSRFCTKLPACSSKFGYSFMLACIGSGLANLAFIFIFFYFVLNLCCCRSAAPEVDSPKQRSSSPIGKGKQTVAQTKGSPQGFDRIDPTGGQNPLGRVDPRGGTNLMNPSPVMGGRAPTYAMNAEDWRFDEASNLYWSQTSQMYYDHQSKQYYDPRSEKWYDPVKGTWYDL